MIIAIIPARGGSKRLPRKNVKMMCGRPLVAWSFIIMRCSSLVDSVWLTTDDEEIAEIGREYGVNVLMREDPAESTDEAGGGVPTYAAIQKVKKIYSFDTMIACLPTCILIKRYDIDNMLKIYQKENIDVIWTASRPEETLILKRLNDKEMEPFIMDQEREYLSMGIASTVIKVKLYELIHSFSMDYNLPVHITGRYYEVEEWQRFDIDNQDDWDIAEYYFERRLKDVWNEAWEQTK